MTENIHFSKKSNYWRTPKDLYEYFNRFFKGFVLDAAATPENALCAKFYTEEMDALKQDWFADVGKGPIWLNCPYGKFIKSFVKKAFEEAQKGCTVVMLIPARVDTKWWHNYCAKQEVLFIKGRVTFEDDNNTGNPAPFPSAIVVFKKDQVPQTCYVEQVWKPKKK